MKRQWLVALLSVCMLVLSTNALVRVAALVCLVAAIVERDRDYLDAVSAMFWKTDLLGTTSIHAVAVFDRAVPTEKLISSFLAAYVERFPRFRQRVQPGTWASLWAWPCWAECDTFDAREHFIVHDTPLADQAQLEAALAVLLSTPLVPGRPPWEVVFFPQYCDTSAVIVRVHHAMADGVTIARVLLSGFEGVTPLVRPVRASPLSLGQTVRMWLAFPLQALASLARLTISPSDAASPLKPQHGSPAHEPRTAGFAQAQTSVSSLKALAHDAGVSINDIVLAAFAGALRRFWLSRPGAGTPPPHDVTCVMWVSLRPLSDVYEPIRDAVRDVAWGNQGLAAVYLQLPLAQASARARLRAVHAATGALLHSIDPLVTAWLMRTIGLLPTPLARLVYNACGYKVTLSASNIPGPPGELAFAGAPVRTLLFFVPPQQRVGLVATLISQHGRVSCGLGALPELCSSPDCRAITGALFEEEIAALRAAVAAERAPTAVHASD